MRLNILIYLQLLTIISALRSCLLSNVLVIAIHFDTDFAASILPSESSITIISVYIKIIYVVKLYYRFLDLV